LITPVVTNPKKATNALFWAVREMERRYELLSEMGARNIKQYNNKVAKAKKPVDKEPPEKLPYIVIVIDELADLMILASRDVEVALTRLAQMARAAGIHLILATQRPSVDVLTGIIKANFPTRLTFQVSSKTDSRTIIDTVGAENLLGSGDMLFLPPGTAKLQRVHGAYISETELSQINAFLRHQEKPDYDEEVIEVSAIEPAESDDDDYDERYDDAVALITKTGQASISMIQRHLRSKRWKKRASSALQTAPSPETFSSRAMIAGHRSDGQMTRIPRHSKFLVRHSIFNPRLSEFDHLVLQ
jgi:S-DNA-T family DNA segregation ATPase FtsK/SpoIIIE